MHVSSCTQRERQTTGDRLCPSESRGDRLWHTNTRMDIPRKRALRITHTLPVSHAQQHISPFLPSAPCGLTPSDRMLLLPLSHALASVPTLPPPPHAKHRSFLSQISTCSLPPPIIPSLLAGSSCPPVSLTFLPTRTKRSRPNFVRAVLPSACVSLRGRVPPAHAHTYVERQATRIRCCAGKVRRCKSLPSISVATGSLLLERSATRGGRLR